MTIREHPALGWWMAFAGAFGFSFKAVLVKLAYRYGVDAETILANQTVKEVYLGHEFRL